MLMENEWAGQVDEIRAHYEVNQQKEILSLGSAPEGCRPTSLVGKYQILTYIQTSNLSSVEEYMSSMFCSRSTAGLLLIKV